MEDVSAIIILSDTSEDRNYLKNEGRPSYNHALDTPEDEISMKNGGRPSYNLTFRYARG